MQVSSLRRSNIMSSFSCVLGMEDEEPYDPLYMSDDEGMHNSQKIIII